MLPVEIVILALSTLFTYLWQRHRIQNYFLPLLFTARGARLDPARRAQAARAQELPRRRHPGDSPSRIPGRPLRLPGVALRRPSPSLSSDQKQLLFGAGGAPLPSISVQALEAAARSRAAPRRIPVPLIGPFDTIASSSAFRLGLALVLVYVFLIAAWTATDIARPIEELRANMARAEAGDLSAITPATSANEIGELAVGFNAMLKGIAERGRIKELFGQYLTKEISEAILEGRVRLDGARYEATVMFTDIRGFTAMSECLEPEEVFAFLNDYLGRMIDVIAARGGIIDKFLGDGILAVFGLPVPSATHADDAFAAAMDMRLPSQR